MSSSRWSTVNELVVDLGRVCSSLQEAEAQGTETLGLKAATEAKQKATNAVSMAASGDQDTGDFSAAVQAAREAIALARETVAVVRLTVAQSRALRHEARELVEQARSNARDSADDQDDPVRRRA